MERRYVSMIIGLVVVALIAILTAVLIVIYSPWVYAVPFVGLAILSASLLGQLVATR